jgi:hypothetical protein
MLLTRHIYRQPAENGQVASTHTSAHNVWILHTPAISLASQHSVHRVRIIPSYEKSSAMHTWQWTDKTTKRRLHQSCLVLCSQFAKFRKTNHVLRMIDKRWRSTTHSFAGVTELCSMTPPHTHTHTHTVSLSLSFTQTVTLPPQATIPTSSPGV